MEFVHDFFLIVGVLTTLLALAAFVTNVVVVWTAPR